MYAINFANINAQDSQISDPDDRQCPIDELVGIN